MFWQDLIARRRGWRWAAGAALALALLMTPVLHDTAILHLPRKLTKRRC